MGVPLVFPEVRDEPGAVVVVSHDRWFLDRVATHVLHLDGRGGVQLHTGDLSSLLDRLVREQADADAAGTGARGGGRRAGGAGKPSSSRAASADTPRVLAWPG